MGHSHQYVQCSAALEVHPFQPTTICEARITGKCLQAKQGTLFFPLYRQFAKKTGIFLSWLLNCDLRGESPVDERDRPPTTKSSSSVALYNTAIKETILCFGCNLFQTSSVVASTLWARRSSIKKTTLVRCHVRGHEALCRRPLTPENRKGGINSGTNVLETPQNVRKERISANDYEPGIYDHATRGPLFSLIQDRSLRSRFLLVPSAKRSLVTSTSISSSTPDATPPPNDKLLPENRDSGPITPNWRATWKLGNHMTSFGDIG
ncbi:hypothetical protein CDAR_168261 [Caerostris darwini]|uniref:Uncharacterized protein n=1 Tax=Caerostris darwini TaxID=1538125 RepID=A0AAV4T451_9ARAC|nr:hypothetical protein CDAR_168261 [Caerostris darwini]